ncbi:hypothetical protein ScPMuIL_002437 [Solemya velum]
MFCSPLKTPIRKIFQKIRSEDQEKLRQLEIEKLQREREETKSKAVRNRKGRTPRKRNGNTGGQQDPVEVYCRIRPLDNPDAEVCIKPLSPNVVQLCPSENSVAATRNGQLREYQYTFQHVFDEYTSQKAVFDYVALPLVEDIIHGKNSLLFTYGITSSGKTYTMTGHPKDQGILPRALDVLFNSIGGLQAKKYVFKPDKMNGFEIQTEADAMMERQKKDILPGICPKTPSTPRMRDKIDFADQGRVCDPSKVEDVDEDCSYAVYVSYIEIYNNFVYDLLEELPYDPITGYRPPQSKILRTDGNDNMYVFNCVEVEIKSPDEAFEVLYKGQKRRKVAHTALNAESSRSHSIFNIRLIQAPLDPQGEEVLQDSDKVCISQLSLVDLAGSERMNRTKNSGERLKEAGNINQSLMVLRTCLEMLRENQNNAAGKMVPYRDSKLTHIFKNYFDGDGKVRMVVCVNPKAEEYDETIHVMKFAEMTQEVLVSRSQQVRFDLGLTPGRRHLNQQHRDAVVKAQELGDVPIPVMTYSLGSSFPPLELIHADDSKTLNILADFLQDRYNRRQTLLLDFEKKQEQFRAILIELEKENSELKGTKDEMESILDKKEKHIKKLESKVQFLEKKQDGIQRNYREIEWEKRDLENKLQDKNQRVLRERNEKERLKADFRARLEMNNNQWEQNLEQERKKMETAYGGQLFENRRRMNLLKSIVNENGQIETETKFKTPVPTPRGGRQTRTYTTPGVIQTAKSDTDVSKIGTPRSRTATTSSVVSSARSMQNLNRGTTPAKTAPYNTRHRRSKSSSNAEVWLDHKPSTHVKLDTVLQPEMKKKKSVSKLEVKDTKDASKYCLTTQETTSNGGIKTKLYKGDVLPTAGGGAAVVFNDLETLRQTSPPRPRKRRSSCPEPPADLEGDWTDTETRCAIAMEGHAHKRTKSSYGTRV